MQETIGPYRLLRPLGRGGMGVVHEAVAVEGGPRVALKTVDVPRARDLAAIRREIEALERVVHPSIVRIVDHGVCAGVPWYAMELLEGETLRDYLTRLWADDTTAQTLSLDVADVPLAFRSELAHPQDRRPAAAGRLAEVLDLFVHVCDALELVHGLGIVHRDLKPANIFLRRDGPPTLTDFGLAIASSPPSGRDVLVDARFQGTPAYISPEQISGETVDGRADLYALGCVLYHCVTGRPPFPGVPSAALTGHLHDEPLPASALVTGVPLALDALLRRLLNKRARDRPAYANDVRAALVALGARADERATTNPRYLYRASLSGRSRELGQLLATLERAADRRGGLVLVRGESGIGKTRLVAELAGAALRGGRFSVVSGECTPSALRNDAPSSPSATPLEPLRPLLTVLADECRERGPVATQRMLGELGRHLVPFEPSLATLPGAPAWPSAEASAEWLCPAVFRAMAMLAESKPLVLLLDDLQWADQATLDVLLALAPDELARHRVLIVALYRTEEETKELRALFERHQRDAISLTRLETSALERAACDMLAVDALPPALCAYLAEQTDGIPFFIGECLRMALEAGVIERDASGLWDLASSPAEIRGRLPWLAMSDRSLPAGLRDVAVRRLGTLPDDTRRIVRVAAVLGRSVDVGLVADVADVPLGVALDAVLELVQRGVLGKSDLEGFRFSHDKLLEAAYAGTPAEERAALHQRAAERIELRADADVFVVANHYKLGVWGAAPRKSFEACLRAGTRALDTLAATDALRYFESAAAIAGATGIPLDARLHTGCGEACVRLERPDEALTQLRAGLALESNDTRRARIRVSIAFVHLTHFRADDAADACRAALAELRVATEPIESMYDAWRTLAPRVAAGPLDSAELERLTTAASAFRIHQLAAYYRMDSVGFTAAGLRAYLVARKLGRRPEAVPALACASLSLAGLRLTSASARTVHAAVALADELDDRGAQAVARSVACITHTFRGDLARALLEYRELMPELGSWLSGLDHINATGDMIWGLSMLGHSREARAIGDEQLANLRRARGFGGHAEGHAAQAFPQLVVASMLGDRDAPLTYLALADAPRFAELRFHRVFVSACKIAWFFETNALGEAFEAAVAEYLALAPPPELTILHINAFHVFHTYARRELIEEARGNAERLTRFRKSLALLERAGGHPVFRGHALVLRASKLRLEGRDNQAALARAEAHAHETDSEWMRYEIDLERARSTEDAARARTHLERARARATAAGWRPRVERMERALGALTARAPSRATDH